jgi:hypothetical protein
MITVDEQKCLRPLKHWELGFESHSRHEYVTEFPVLSCIGSGLETGLIKRPRIPTSFHIFRIISEWEQARGINPSKWKKKIIPFVVEVSY